jgi:HTH-type transcriptional regulator/antitoxin HigA
MGRPQQAVNEIVRGKKALTAETAVELERVLGIPAYLWLRMEARYRLALARHRHQESVIA